MNRRGLAGIFGGLALVGAALSLWAGSTVALAGPLGVGAAFAAGIVLVVALTGPGTGREEGPPVPRHDVAPVPLRSAFRDDRQGVLDLLRSLERSAGRPTPPDVREQEAALLRVAHAEFLRQIEARIESLERTS